MSILKNITKGKIRKPVFMCLYGESGIGKTTFASSAPKPLFIATEEGSNELDVSRLQVTSWSEFKESLVSLETEGGDFESIIIDSLDHLEALIHDQVAKDAGKKSIDDIGYGKGYGNAVRYWKSLIVMLKKLRDNNGQNIILISHTHVKTFNDPHHNEAYDRFELKMHKSASAIIKESVDMLLFARNDVAFKKDSMGNKSQVFNMDNRVIYTELNAAFDAKNRFGLPPVIDFPISGAFDVLKKELDSLANETPEFFYNQIKRLLESVKDSSTVEMAAKHAEENKDNIEALKLNLNRVKTILQGEIK